MEYYNRSIDGLQNDNIQESLNFIFVSREPNSENSLYRMFTNIIDSGVSNSTGITSTISNFFDSTSIGLLNLAETSTNNSMGQLILLYDLDVYHMLLSTFIVVILKLFEYNVIISGLLASNGCEIFASLLFDRLEWSVLKGFVSNNPVMEGVRTLIGKLIHPVLTGGDFNDTVIRGLNYELSLRDNHGKLTVISDTFVFITLFSDVLKAFLEHNVHELVSKRS